jgi:cardiolipin synthase
MSIIVAIPLRFATIRLYVDKGRKWSAVEHFLLYALDNSAQSATEIVASTNLPWRLVVEVMTRLMRVGWVELLNRKDDIAFQMTNAGKSVVSNEILPAVTRQTSKQSSFVVDGSSGAVFRARDLSLRSRNQLEKLRETSAVLELDGGGGVNRFELDEVISALLDEDEHCRGVEPLASRFIERFALVNVSEGEIDGLPASAPSELRTRIIEAVESACRGIKGSVTQDNVVRNLNSKKIIPFDFQPKDLIVGGEEHRRFFTEVISRASSWIVIHSTFINSARFGEHLPLIVAAAKRGVRIDILWGKSIDPDGTNKMQNEIEMCRDMLVDSVSLERVRLHRFTTDSHAKIIFADNGLGSMIGSIGSCNWLSSSFHSFDVSVVFSSSHIVGEIAAKLSAMAIGKSGHWSVLAGDLAAQAANLSRKESNRTTAGNWTATIISGSDHNDYMQKARDEAKSNINVVSHRVSLNADTLVFVPSLVAVRSSGTTVNLYYELRSGVSDETLVEKLIQKNSIEGLNFFQVTTPSLHAKFLTWDEDNVVITSQNWLSADPMDTSFSEIGVAISGKGIATELLRRSSVVIGSNL